MEPLWRAALISETKSLFTYSCCLQFLKEHWASEERALLIWYWCLWGTVMRLLINVRKQRKPHQLKSTKYCQCLKSHNNRERQMTTGGENRFKKETKKEYALPSPALFSTSTTPRWKCLTESNKDETCHTEFILKTTRQRVRAMS